MDIPIQRRSFAAEVREAKDDARTIELSFSSEEPVSRFFGKEILDHSGPDSINFRRLSRSAPLLLNHDPDRQIGVIQKAWLDRDVKKGRAVVRFSKSELGQEIYQDVKDGIRPNVSVGYSVAGAKTEDEGEDTYRFKGWEPLEISITAISADTTVGAGRSLTMSDTLTTPTDRAEAHRIREINSLGKRHNLRDKADKFIEENKSVDEFKDFVLATRHSGGTPLVVATDKPGTPQAWGNVGMDGDSIEGYSFLRAIRQFSENKRFDGPELEASRAAEKKYGHSAPQNGLICPLDVLDFNASTFTQGGALVQTEQGTFIDKLRNKALVTKLGAQTLLGLVGNVSLPKAGDDCTAEWLTETAAITESTGSLGQLALTPHRIGAYADISRQLLIQGTPDAEAYVRSMLQQVIGVAFDRAAIRGSGNAGEPLGILNNTGVNAVTFSTAATWAKVLDFEKEIDSDNALDGSLAWLTTPATRAKWKAAVKVTGQAVFLWEDLGNMVNGYPAYTTNQFPSSGTINQVIFGNWNDIVLGIWGGGLTFTVDPFSKAEQNLVRVIVNMHGDLGIKHPESFTISTDSGAQ